MKRNKNIVENFARNYGSLDRLWGAADHTHRAAVIYAMEEK